jgi:hypothetical protein
VTEFAGQFPADVAAIVLADVPSVIASGATRTAPSPWLARTGILRLSQQLSGRAPGVPGPRGGAVDAFSTRPDHLTRAGQELRQFDAVLARASASVLPEVPVRRVDAPAGGSSLDTAQDAQPLVQAIIDVLEEIRRD